jgi:hypothetical protein
MWGSYIWTTQVNIFFASCSLRCAASVTLKSLLFVLYFLRTSTALPPIETDVSPGAPCSPGEFRNVKPTEPCFKTGPTEHVQRLKEHKVSHFFIEVWSSTLWLNVKKPVSHLLSSLQFEFSNPLTYSLTPWSRTVLERLNVTHLVRKFPASSIIHVTITVFTWSSLWILS